MQMDVQGWPGFQIMQKLKVLKGIMKSWNKETFGCVKEEKN